MNTGCDFDGFNLLGGLDFQFSTPQSTDSFSQPPRFFPTATDNSPKPIVISMKKRRYSRTAPSSSMSTCRSRVRPGCVFSFVESTMFTMQHLRLRQQLPAVPLSLFRSRFNHHSGSVSEPHVVNTTWTSSIK